MISPVPSSPGSASEAQADAQRFIATRLPARDVPGLAPLRTHRAAPASGLGPWLAECGIDAPPYWAYLWSGGLALAHHLTAFPELVAGRSVLDLGAGSGLVAIGAARAGASRVLASDSDPLARAVIPLNAALNGVEIAVTGDLLDGDPPPVDLVLAGDTFYAPELARRTTPFLARARANGSLVLVGDPGRAPLPRGRLDPLASYTVRENERGTAIEAAVFTFRG